MVSQHSTFILLKHSLKCLPLEQIIMSTVEIRRRKFCMMEVSQRNTEIFERDKKKELQIHLQFRF